jgi:aminopeptidase-like protein/aminoglycoside N3'-acetyltransferase
MILSTEKMARALYDLGIRSGDHLLVHSAYSALGEVEGGAQTVVESILAAVGAAGTVVMPSFNWDYFRAPEKVIDLCRTPSRMGIISELFRTRNDIRRTTNLFHPLCVGGRYREEILACDMFDTWGEDSPYGFMASKGFKMLMVGVDLNRCAILHYCEQRAAARYRQPVIYDGFIVSETGERRACRCRRLVLKDGAMADLNKGADALTEKNCRTAVVGNALCRLVDLGDFVQVVCRGFERDPDYLKLIGPLCRPMATQSDQDGFTPTGLMSELHPMNRALVSDGFDRALDRIARILPMKIRRFESGTRIQTWTVPDQWTLRRAYIETQDGRRIVDTADHLLHVATGSIPFSGTVTHSELMARLTTDPARPEVVPYRILYYRDDWGFCTRHADLNRFDADAYRVHIEAELGPGQMRVGEVEKKGLGDKIIVLPIHLDHPGQCNDNLSGVVVATALALRLKRCPSTRYTYRILFVPESIGTLAWLERYRELLPRIAGGIVIDSVGHDNRIFLMTSRRGDTYLDRISRHVLRRRLADAEVYPFLHPAISSFSNDERMLQSPGFDIAAVAFSRAPYAHYHASTDTPERLSGDRLAEALELVWEVIDVLETDFVPVRRFDGVPFLSGLGLWRADWTPGEINGIERIHYCLDNTMSVFDIAEALELPYGFVRDHIHDLAAAGLVDKKELS